jgi:hypothetical protein
MPLIGQDDETRKSYLEGILSSDYDFKGVVYHGFKKNKTNLEVEDLNKYETIVKTINV